MEVSEINDIINQLYTEPELAIKRLQVSSYDIPDYLELYKQYDPLEHEIMTNFVKYPMILDEKTMQDKVKRTPLALQELAVNRLAQGMFSVPVKRYYKTNNDKEEKAAAILEGLYEDNDIDTTNIERAKKLNMSCQIATIWMAYDEQSTIEEYTSSKTLTHSVYSEKDGYKLYPQIDKFGRITIISIFYLDTNKREIVEIYTNDIYLRLVHEVDKWVIDSDVSKKIDFMPVIYQKKDKPAWGGKAGTILVEQLEELETDQGTYIKDNQIPTFILDLGKVKAGDKKSIKKEESTDTRRIVEVGEGGSAKEMTWDGKGETVQQKITRIKDQFFEQNQIPNNSYANMINSKTSADNKELILSDSKSKAADEAGEWIKAFKQEFKIIKKFASVMFPAYRTAIENLQVKFVVTPYSYKSKKENAEYISIAGDSMSLETRIKILGEVEDVNEEADKIIQEQSAMTNQGIL